MFQSTRPRGARQGCPRPSGDDKCFNPRARVGRDAEARKLKIKTDVSIHAPAWGATSGEPHGPYHRNVSIHAPAWGATCRKELGKIQALVSIHAPAWGATKL